MNIGIPTAELIRLTEIFSQKIAVTNEARADAEARAAELGTQLGSTQKALIAFFRRVGEAGVDLDALPTRLFEFAERYKALLAQATTEPSDDTETARLRREVRAALEEGDFEHANALRGNVLAVRVRYLTSILDRLFGEERLYAIQTLGEMGPEAAPAVPALISALKEPDEFVTESRPELDGPGFYKEAPIEYSIRESAACALTRVGPAAMPAIFAVLRDSDQQGRRLAAAALIRFRSDVSRSYVVASLVAALGDIEEDVRWNAAAALVEIGVTAAPELIEAFSGPDEDTQRTAMGIIIKIGVESAPILIHAIQDRNGRIRANAATTLGEIVREFSLMDDFQRFLLGLDNWSSYTVVKALVTALNDAEVEVQLSVVRALGRIGSLAAEAATALVRVSNSHNELVQRQVKLALEQIHGPQNLKRLGGELSGVLGKIELSGTKLPRLGQRSIIKPAD